MTTEKPYSDDGRYVCKLCGWPKNSKEIDGSSFAEIFWVPGAPGKAAMEYIEKHHPEEACAIYAEMRKPQNSEARRDSA